jgi:hypothetical protein
MTDGSMEVLLQRSKETEGIHVGKNLSRSLIRGDRKQKFFIIHDGNLQLHFPICCFLSESRTSY